MNDRSRAEEIKRVCEHYGVPAWTAEQFARWVFVGERQLERRDELIERLRAEADRHATERQQLKVELQELRDQLENERKNSLLVTREALSLQEMLAVRRGASDE